MDSFELNKIIGAILGTLLFVMGAGFLAEAIYAPIEGRGPGYSLPEAEAGAGGEAVAEAPKLAIGTLLASANIQQGEAAVSRCMGCHNFEEGAGNKQGPGLYNVVGRQMAGVESYDYGDALEEMGAAGEAWTYEHLNDFLLAPAAFAPDTKMKFGGLKNDADRANVIAYLSTLSASPLPYPPPEPAEGTTAEAAPAAEGDEPVATDADAVATPTETQDETAVEGTPTTSGTDGAPAPGAGDGAVVPEVPAQ